MTVYKVIKVLNNNVVTSKDETGQDVIVTGNGIGYGVKAGFQIPAERINRVYEAKSQKFVNRFSTLLNEIPYECFEAAVDIKEQAEVQLRQQLKTNLILALADHISLILDQYKRGEQRTILMSTEMQQFYSLEYKIGIKAKKMVEERFGILCDPAEVSAFTFHIVNAEMTGRSDDAARIMQSIRDILDVIQKSLGIVIPEDSMDYSRMIIHLKFFLKRVLSNDVHDDEQFGPLMINTNEGSFAGIAQCLDEISVYVKRTYDYDITESEKVYLLIHIARNIQSQKG